MFLQYGWGLIPLRIYQLGKEIIFMKRLISAILALTIIFSMGADITIGYARYGIGATNTNTWKPTDDPIFWYESPVDENGKLDYEFYPTYKDPQDITDEEFFGEWDPLENTWLKVPYFGYAEQQHRRDRQYGQQRRMEAAHSSEAPQQQADQLAGAGQPVNGRRAVDVIKQVYHCVLPGPVR